MSLLFVSCLCLECLLSSKTASYFHAYSHHHGDFQKTENKVPHCFIVSHICLPLVMGSDASSSTFWMFSLSQLFISSFTFIKKAHTVLLFLHKGGVLSTSLKSGWSISSSDNLDSDYASSASIFCMCWHRDLTAGVTIPGLILFPILLRQSLLFCIWF